MQVDIEYTGEADTWCMLKKAARRDSLHRQANNAACINSKVCIQQQRLQTGAVLAIVVVYVRRCTNRSCMHGAMHGNKWRCHTMKKTIKTADHPDGAKNNMPHVEEEHNKACELHGVT